MCGICGLASLDGGTPPSRKALTEMSATIRHRGPDSDGSVFDGPVALAARRLSIIDIKRGDQPLANEDGTVRVVQNGEIYNHRELAAELRGAGHRLATRCDTEVLAHLYEDRGPAFAAELRGMFAIAIWDASRRRLVLARDPFGIKPLFYSLAGGVLAFGSELKAVLRAPGVTRRVDMEAVQAFLCFNSIPGPLSAFADVQKLPPGHLLIWDAGGEPRIERYARPAPAPKAEQRRERAEDLAPELLGRLRDSVRAHLIADVPVGVMLSGGVDSSALTALAAECSSRPVSTFSIGFEEASFDELERARLVAQRYGTDHHELVVRPDAVELLPKLVECFDEPFADSSAIPTYLVSQLASSAVKVALSGEGGDELFGGYHTYAADRLAPLLGRPAALARPLIELLPSSSRKVSFDYRAKRFSRAATLPPLARHHGWKEIFSADAREELLGAGGFDPVEFLGHRFAETEGADTLARLQDVDIGVYLVDDLLVKTDRASMVHSLETRVPFLDPEVYEMAMSLPPRHRVLAFSKKRLLRRAVAPLLPHEILQAPKQGFSVPMASWLRGDLQGYARDLLSSDTVERQGFFDPPAVQRLIERHVTSREDLSRQLWSLMTFTAWFDRYASESSSR